MPCYKKENDEAKRVGLKNSHHKTKKKKKKKKKTKKT